MIRDLMVECVECRFSAARPQPVQWLSDNGSAYATAGTIEIATALNLTPCFTPVESPEAMVSPMLSSIPSNVITSALNR
jgi:transposase InsO family protein